MYKKYKYFNPYFLLTLFILFLGLTFFLSSLVFLICLTLFILILSYPLFLKFTDYLYKVTDISDECVFAKTKDNWNLALHIHRTQNPVKEAYPVVIAHGIMTNKYSVDLDYSHSLAYYLKLKGYTVFAINLRGSGLSYHNSKNRTEDFNFDDIIENDIPAIIQNVCSITGAKKINWIGHSMGAMIMQCYLARGLSEVDKVASFTSIAGPGTLNHLRDNVPLNFFTRYQKRLMKFIDLRLGVKLLAPLGGRVSTSFDQLFYIKENITGLVLRRFMCNASENIAPGLANQFSEWITTGKETTKNGQFNYPANYFRIQLPALFLSAIRDGIAVPSSIHFVYEEAESKHKKYVLFSKSNGHSIDYCHLSLVLGERAKQDVYPVILDWLEKHGKNKEFTMSPSRFTILKKFSLKNIVNIFERKEN